MRAIMDISRTNYNRDGFVFLKGFFSRDEVTQVKEDAKGVFLRQLHHRGMLPPASIEQSKSEKPFEKAMAEFFNRDFPTFSNCGKACQHLVSLHRLSLDPRLMQAIQAVGVSSPVVCTRPVMYFNARSLAKAEVHYKTPPHQDWRSMQGSLNSVVAWIPLVDVPQSLGALRIIPGSHVRGLLDSQQDEWYRHVDGINESDFVSVEVEAGDVLIFSSFLVHASGDNITPSSIRWSCHFRYNDLDAPDYIERNYATPYIYKPQQELITPDYPNMEAVRAIFQN
jgi:phytanoyl-CoA hydroxylase